MIEPDDRIEYAGIMADTGVATRSDVNDADMKIFWDRFASWSIDDFRSAMAKCADELPRFPTVSQVRSSFPKRYETADDFQYQRIEHKVEVDQGLEDFIDKMSDNELLSIVFGKDAGGRFSLRQYKKCPQGVYRAVVREKVVDRHPEFSNFQETA